MERAHDISLDEPTVAHQAILFMLDVLMRNDSQALTIAQLYDSFGDKTFTPQMLRAVGGNEQGLKQFLLRYPSLFTIMGDTVSANSGNSMRITPDRQYLKRNKSKEEEIAQTIEYDSKTMKEIEQEAIAFFKKQMTKREEDWLPIVSVAGHASQSSADVRKYVGPQNEFKTFLQKYPNVFVVRDEYCGLKGRADLSTQPFPPPSPPPKRRLATGSGLNRSHSFKNRYSTCSTTSNGNSIINLNQFNPNAVNNGVNVANVANTNGINPMIANGVINMSGSNGINANSASQAAKPRLTPIEVKAVHYVMRILHKQGRMLLQNIPGLISRAPDHVSNIVGFTREDLIQFFKRHSAIFQLHPDGCVSVKQDAIKALILKDRTFGDASIFTGNGIILRIFPKYGILNLDNNEQVFFDIQSCQFETFSDLTTILHVGDRLWFNGVIGPRDGSTKWRSLKTWIKTKDNQTLINDNGSSDAGKSDDSSSNGYNHSLNGSPNFIMHSVGNGQMIQSNSNNYISVNAYNNSSNNSSVVAGGMSSSMMNTSISNNNINAISSPVLASAGVNGANTNSNQSSTSNSMINIEEDFNQYQLEVEYTDTDANSNALNTSTNLNSNNHNNNNGHSDLDDDFNRLSLSSSQSLSSIVNNTNANNTSTTPPLPAPTTTTTTASNKFNKNDSNLVNLNSNTTGMYMKHASDNISKREICTHNAQYVNMGCQTLSTGDIMATNVYIE